MVEAGRNLKRTQVPTAAPEVQAAASMNVNSSWANQSQVAQPRAEGSGRFTRTVTSTTSTALELARSDRLLQSRALQSSVFQHTLTYVG